jgi:serine/threonine protein kinase
LEELENRKILHRDVKPDNFLFVNGKIKLSDFGASKYQQEINNPYVVSQYYRAPELLLGCKDYNEGIDVWAATVIFFEFLFKKLPFYAKEEGE